ncbi:MULTISPECIES: NAD-dependent epimerase/dehydratase family protein [Pseudomonas]|uniref:NAD-dependent epimerase/dehydratase family protein n=1 Tax=Pseudomonas TaxID=286 RepID=UPI00069E2FB3|nr:MULTISPECIES: NAD-dependent epimerase/dehydratase family protein [Pseudomonas]MCE0461037.1 NAD-dependent epimerase/dehydratase family protein [Pseudomonas uvaldensis]
MKILVTGVAGFIGFHTARRLCHDGHQVIGLDNLNGYYSVELKQARLSELAVHDHFRFRLLDVADKQALLDLFAEDAFDCVVHLAAQAGVRHSLDNPDIYAQSNLVGFLNVLEACRAHRPEHLIFASSSSVYGLNERMPYATTDSVDQPVSFYAATKRANELMAHAYSHLYGIPTTGLRFFTVYGPWGRPDMAPFKFTEAILGGRAIDLYNEGAMSRDFTYIDDIVEGLVRLIPLPPTNGAGVPNKVYNIGFGSPVKLLQFVECLEEALGMRAIKNFLPLQSGDVVDTWADTRELEERVGFRPQVAVPVGVQSFVDWYRSYYGV